MWLNTTAAPAAGCRFAAAQSMLSRMKWPDPGDAGHAWVVGVPCLPVRSTDKPERTQTSRLLQSGTRRNGNGLLSLIQA